MIISAVYAATGADEPMSGVEEGHEELIPDSLLQKHRNRLNVHREALCSVMSPLPVIMQLRRQGVFTALDQQTITARPTDIGRNGAILDELFKRGPSALHKLVRCLQSLGEKYASIVQILQPVRYRILWFATSPTQAAAVVHALETYHDVKFPAFPGNLAATGKYIVRRATVLMKWVPIEHPGIDDVDTIDCMDDVELCLIFPTIERSGHMTEILNTAFREFPDITVAAVMSGVCDGETEEVVVAKSLVTSSSTMNLAQTVVETAQQTMRSQFSSELFRRFTAARGFSPRAPLIGCVATTTLSPTHSNTIRVTSDNGTQLFYEACRENLPGNIPYFACVGVVKQDSTEEIQTSYTLLSCLTIVEICKTLVDQERSLIKND